jgi:D-aminoacyl-tRNA deacylase
VRVVVQRVTSAAVEVGGTVVGRIGRGFALLVGVGHEDDEARARELAAKVAGLRIFEDDQGKTNLSLLDVQGEALVVSQFTLYADTRKGRRPSFTAAAEPGRAAELVESFRAALAQAGVPTAEGRFAAHMRLTLTNDGPFTLFLSNDRQESGR